MLRVRPSRIELTKDEIDVRLIAMHQRTIALQIEDSKLNTNADPMRRPDAWNLPRKIDEEGFLPSIIAYTDTKIPNDLDAEPSGTVRVRLLSGNLPASSSMPRTSLVTNDSTVTSESAADSSRHLEAQDDGWLEGLEAPRRGPIVPVLDLLGIPSAKLDGGTDWFGLDPRAESHMPASGPDLEAPGSGIVLVPEELEVGDISVRADSVDLPEYTTSEGSGSGTTVQDDEEDVLADVRESIVWPRTLEPAAASPACVPEPSSPYVSTDAYYLATVAGGRVLMGRNSYEELGHNGRQISGRIVSGSQIPRSLRVRSGGTDPQFEETSGHREDGGLSDAREAMARLQL